MDTLRHNVKDPLINVTPDKARELFSQLSRACNGFSEEDVTGAAFNLVLNAMRQKYGTRNEAEKAWDETISRIKGVLMNHYDVGGRRRGVFPYTQNIVMPFVNGNDKF